MLSIIEEIVVVEASSSSLWRCLRFLSASSSSSSLRFRCSGVSIIVSKLGWMTGVEPANPRATTLRLAVCLHPPLKTTSYRISLRTSYSPN